MARNELKYMEAAIAVAKELSFSRAARRLRLSQPAITKQIAELEESLGVILFLRDHHVVSLTDAGRAYVEEARIFPAATSMYKRVGEPATRDAT
jgi:DNA-binding transcriptional LysR family regulator